MGPGGRSARLPGPDSGETEARERRATRRPREQGWSPSRPAPGSGAHRPSALALHGAALSPRSRAGEAAACPVAACPGEGPPTGVARQAWLLREAAWGQFAFRPTEFRWRVRHAAHSPRPAAASPCPALGRSCAGAWVPGAARGAHVLSPPPVCGAGGGPRGRSPEEEGPTGLPRPLPAPHFRPAFVLQPPHGLRQGSGTWEESSERPGRRSEGV